MTDTQSSEDVSQKLDFRSLFLGIAAQFFVTMLFHWILLGMSPGMPITDPKIVIASIIITGSTAVGLSIYIFGGWKNTSLHFGIWGMAITYAVAMLLQAVL